MSRLPAPDPRELRFHRSVGRLAGAYPELAAGIAFDGVTARYGLVNVAGLERFRLRALTATAAATLACRFIRPTESIPDTVDLTTQAGLATAYASYIYTANQPADVALVAGTENILTVTGHGGEGYALIRLIGGGAGTLTYLDFSGV